MKREIPTILSPVNSYEGVRRVIRAGADEIYCGVAMPGRLRNLSLYRGPGKTDAQLPGYDELGRIVALAHDHDVRVILVDNEPFMSVMMEQEMKSHIENCLTKDVDAIIVGDIGILQMLKDSHVELPLYASTYFVSMNYEAVEFLRKIGFSRVILERHLTLSEIAEIVNHSKVDIEVFCHGGGCSNLNGSCYLYHFGTSGGFGLTSIDEKSRGLPPCTFYYDVYDLSKKDKVGTMPIIDAHTGCSICYLDALVQTGVAGIKIVGRLDSVEFQETSTSVYRQLLDLIAHKNISSFEIRKKAKALRKRLFYLSALGEFENAFCKQKRCYFSPLFNAPYKRRSLHVG